MSNIEKYNKAFIDSFDINENQLVGLKYQDIAEWNSVGHMTLIATLEDLFDVMFDGDDILDFKSYEKGMEILSKETYGVKF